ncbi:MAG: peptidoglycan-binding protein [Steroidobacteraceae bacterium]
MNDDRSLKETRLLEPASIASAGHRPASSFVVDRIVSDLPSSAQYDDAVWDQVLQVDRIKSILTEFVLPQANDWYKRALQSDARPGRQAIEETNALLAQQLSRESTIAGYLLFLKANNQLKQLKNLFYDSHDHIQKLVNLIAYRDPLDLIDPFRDLDRAGFSPIGIVHLFRQYFFEFDTFLGPPVSHVWLSPGATVELTEISTRRTVIERGFETARETVVKTETALTEEDEISDAVKEDNRSETKFGMGATVNQSWVSGSASASANIDMGTTQSKAREQTHRHMRQQTEKLSTEIRKNYKSTFKTVTEATDVSSKRYVLSNATNELINYELRRKMRQVGVQVQDIGTYLCWQTYVDDPGRQLGIAKLVHIAKGPEVGTTPAPGEPVFKDALETELPIAIPFERKHGDPLLEDDDAYKHGKEADEELHEGTEGYEAIKADFHGFELLCPEPGYEFDGIRFDVGGHDVRITENIVEILPGKVRFSIHLDHVHFHGVAPLNVTAIGKWTPSPNVNAKIQAEYEKELADYDQASRHEFQKAFVDAARERIKLASNITPRKFEDLREEERIVVYRALVQDMLTKDIPMPDDRTRHVVAELLNTIFDMDKMLYFVAAEWWRPRLHRGHQWLGGLREPGAAAGTGTAAGGSSAPNTLHGKIKTEALKNVISEVLKPVPETHIAPIDTVSWGGTNGNRPDNYYITEESEPAKLGSSLGWLLQLDGDNMRNAFLNAPWVKAVIPIRPGRERAAINWLQRLNVEGAEGLDDKYVAPPEQLEQIPHSGPFVTIRDAILHLCDIVAEKHAESLKVSRYPADEINDDNRVSATPVDKVYEHGFYPLQGGFRALAGGEDFEVFDQWVEVLPTDQMVPVEVEYDPMTGRQI